MKCCASWLPAIRQTARCRHNSPPGVLATLMRKCRRRRAALCIAPTRMGCRPLDRTGNAPGRSGDASGLDRKRINAAVPTPVNPHSSVPIKGDHLSDKDAAQSQSVGACRNQKRRATFLRTCSSGGSGASCRGMDTDLRRAMIRRAHHVAAFVRCRCLDLHP
jgi:hypothetical protein